MVNVSIIGGSGFAGGELARLLIAHPEVEIKYITSRKYLGKPISVVHPNLDGISDLKYSNPDLDLITKDVDVVFIATPHGTSQKMVPQLLEMGLKIIDLSADFRLKKIENYKRFYGDHCCPNLFDEAIYGLPELNKEKIRTAQLIAVPGCHASSALYGLIPALKNDLIHPFPIIIDSKTGSTGAGVTPTLASHHPIRANVIRPYKVVGHRHTAEIEETLFPLIKKDDEERKMFKISFSAHSVDAVRGILSTIHVFLKDHVTEKKTIFKAFRSFAKENPFIRFVKKNTGVFKLPDPKVVVGTNYCDIGFEIDPLSNRLVIVSALDNLIKGAAGNAVQCFNILFNFSETIGLDQIGLFPI
ncbi:MAG: N-acetyl-gamma-glutamyl-phosphate reductase [Promethearchaeota archaeon]